MKKNVHPRYNKITAYCICSNKIEINSTLSNDLNLDICAFCHPFYTGKQRVVDTSGRIDKFNRRMNFSS